MNRLKIASLALVLSAAGAVFLHTSSQALPEALRYPFANLLEARAKNRTALYQQEIGFYLQRVERNPSDGLDRAALAGVYLKRARVTGEATYYLLAEQAAQRSLEALPVLNVGALSVLAEVALAKHDFALAQNYMHQIEKITPHSAALVSLQITLDLALGRVSQATRAIKPLSQAAPSMNTLLLQGFVAEATGKNAAPDYMAALKLEEADDLVGSARARTFLARWWFRHGDALLAKNLLLEATKIVPNDPNAQLLLADVLMQLGDLAGAERICQRLVQTSSQSATLYNHAALRGLARIGRLRGHDEANLWQQAIASLRLELSSGALGHRRELAALLLERGNSDDLPEALRLATAEAQTRQDAETLHVLAWTQLESGKPQQAKLTMQQALRYGVQDAVMFYRMGNIEAALGQTQTAQKWYAKAQTINPHLEPRLFSLEKGVR